METPLAFSTRATLDTEAGRKGSWVLIGEAEAGEKVPEERRGSRGGSVPQAGDIY